MLALGTLYLSALLLILSALLSSGYYFEEVALPALPPDDYEEQGKKEDFNNKDVSQEDLGKDGSNFIQGTKVKDPPPPPTASDTTQSQKQPPTCEYNDKVYPVGKFQLSPCITCECSGTGELSCSTESCPRDPECTLYESVEGQCCPLCVEYGCFYNGTAYPLGAHIFTGDHCKVCYCPWERGNQGKPICMHLDCPTVTECVDAKPPKGKCCPVCPNGANCWYNDMIIPAGKDVWVDKCKSCFCPEPDETTPAGQRQALCYYHSGCT